MIMAEEMIESEHAEKSGSPAVTSDEPENRGHSVAGVDESSTDADGQGRMLAEHAVAEFVDIIRIQAALHDGHLTAENIDAVCDSFREHTAKLASRVSRSLSIYAESHSRTQWDPKRINAFDRVLVNQFSRLLADDIEAVRNSEVVSRRMLSGLFSAIRMMCGPQRIEEFEHEAHLIMWRVRDALQDDFDWYAVYTDPEMQKVMCDLLVEIAPHFADMERRLDWLLSVINGHLTPVGSGAIGANWRLSGHGLVLVVEALFAEILTVLEDDQGQHRIEENYGAEALKAILTIMDGIEHHRDIIAGR